jgi:hypothetical protein
MSKIFTSCVVSGQTIETGIEIDADSFARLSNFTGKVFCPHCKADHEWSKERAWMADGDKPQSA